MNSSSPTILVISDIHLAPERDRGLFKSDSMLVAFLAWMQHNTHLPARLVLAGDSLDFLVPEDGAGALGSFDPKGAVNRTEKIIEAHPEVFEALSSLAANPKMSITWMSGNHDPELVIPEVRAIIERRIRPPGTSSQINWIVNGEAFRFRYGPAQVMVAHGDLLDDWNWIDHDKLQLEVRRHSRGLKSGEDYRVCPGTQIMNEYALRLRHTYPWIDVLKPARDAMFPILSEFVATEDRWRLHDLIKTSLGLVRHSWLRVLLDSFTLQRIRYGSPRTTSAHCRTLSWLSDDSSPTTSHSRLIAHLQVVADEDTSDDPLSPDQTVRDVERLITHGHNDLVILGHTHFAKSYPIQSRRAKSAALYANSGTWAELLRLPKSDEMMHWKAFLANLEKNQYTTECFPTCVQLSMESEYPQAGLMKWTQAGPAVISAWQFRPSHGWTGVEN